MSSFLVVFGFDFDLRTYLYYYYGTVCVRPAGICGPGGGPGLLAEQRGKYG